MSGYQSGYDAGLPNRPYNNHRSQTASDPPVDGSYHQQDSFSSSLQPAQSAPGAYNQQYGGGMGGQQPEYVQGHHVHGHPQSQPAGAYNGPRGRAATFHPSGTLMSAVSPGPCNPTENQLNTAFGYAVRATDGTYIRLVRADQVPSGRYDNVSNHHGPEGLIIVPEPRQPSPTRRYGPMPMVSREVVASLPLNDSQWAPAPQGYSQGPARRGDRNDYSQGHNSMTSPPVRRREKIYCDKWIHEGVCAFTQLGCKYKHEMPMDKATQMTLGLNHGIPNWYRRAYGVHLTSPGGITETEYASPPPTSGYGHHSRLSENWRRGGNDGQTGQGARAAGQIEHRTSPSPNPQGNVLSGPPGVSRHNSYGPIGPPPSQPQFFPGSYSPVKAEPNDDEDEDEGTITWAGRRN